MPDLETTISKIRLPDGTLVNLSNNQKLVVPELAVCNVQWNINNFTGDTSLISGTVADYLLSLSNNSDEWHNIDDQFNKDTQSGRGTSITWDSTGKRVTVSSNPTSNIAFNLYNNDTGFPKGLSPGDDIIFGCGSDNSHVSLYVAYTDGTTWYNLSNSYAASTRAKVTLPANAVGVRVQLYITTGATFSNVYAYPLVLVRNS